MERLSPDIVTMESNDTLAGANEVRNSRDKPENLPKTQPKCIESASTVNVDFIHTDTDMKIIGDGLRQETRNKIEIVESLVRNKQAHFKSQQRGDPDLSLDEKKTIVESLFDKSPSCFLSRFGHFLSKTQLDYFYSFKYRNDQEKEEVLYQLSYLGASKSKSLKTRVKNRRYDALQKMIHSGSYFALEEMQARNPLLFEQLVGRYQTEEEKQTLQTHRKEDLITDGEFPWMQHFAKQVERERLEKLKEQQELDEIGDDDSSDETYEPIPKNDNVSQSSSSLWGEYRGKFQSDNSPKKKRKAHKKKENLKNFQNASEEEKAFYLQEFQNVMYHSFLSGNDKDFDYSSVDNNSEYDCVDMRERDEQDQYFDEESPDSISQADMDITEDSQDELAQLCDGPSYSPSSPPKASMREDTSKSTMDEDDDISAACKRLTEDDVKNLKTFALSWAKNHTQTNSECKWSERTFNPFKCSAMDAIGNNSLSSHKVPVKKNHKIKITLKTKEM